MARKVRTIEIEVDGETTEFHYRKPSWDMMVKQADAAKRKDNTNEKSNRELFRDCLVNRDGSELTKEQFEDAMDSDYDVMQKLSEVLLANAKRKADEAEEGNA